jgi:chromate reductase
MSVLGIAGSLRAESYNARLLRHAAEQAPPGVELDMWSGLRAVPPFDEDHDVEPAPPAVAELRGAIAAADALLIATPEYNHSIPGVLKNAIDWASRPPAETPLMGKPAAVVGASTGRFGAVWAAAELRKVLAATGARVVGPELAIPLAGAAFDPDGRLVEDQHEETFAEIFGALAAEVELDARPIAAQA